MFTTHCLISDKVFYKEIEKAEIDNNFKNENIEISFWDLQYT